MPENYPPCEFNKEKILSGSSSVILSSVVAKRILININSTLIQETFIESVLRENMHRVTFPSQSQTTISKDESMSSTVRELLVSDIWV